MSEDWYEKFMKRVKETSKSVEKPLEVSQDAIWFKTIICDALCDKYEGIYTFKANDKFGFSEGLVNQIIEYAFQYARSQNYSKSDHERIMEKMYFDKGYEQSRKDVIKLIGGITEDDY